MKNIEILYYAYELQFQMIIFFKYSFFLFVIIDVTNFGFLKKLIYFLKRNSKLAMVIFFKIP